jgi:CHAT domain-containing protein/tetratricopeptide (TPR) repeat protein
MAATVRSVSPLLLVVVLSLRSHDARASGGALAAVRDFYRAYAGADAAAMQSIAAFDEARRRALARRLEAMSRASCRTLEGLRVIDRAGGTASLTMRVGVALVKQGRASFAKPQREDHTATLELAPRDGRWLVVAWRIEEHELAERLASAPPAERRALLDAASSLDANTLSRALAQQAIRSLNEGRRDSASALAHEALALATLAGDRGAIALALSAQSSIARVAESADLQHALVLAEEALRVAEEAGDPDILARTLLRAGRAINAATGQLTRGMFERIVAMADALEDASTLVLTGTQLGQQAHGSGDPLAALRYAELTRLYAARTDDPIMQVQPDLHLAGVYATSDFDLRMEHASSALRLAREAAYSIGIASALAILADGYKSAGDDDRFFASANEALARFAEAEVPSEMIALYVARAQFHGWRGRFDDAQHDLDAAMALTGADPRDMAVDFVLLHQANIDLSRGRPEAALAALGRRKLAPTAMETEWWHFWLSANALKTIGKCEQAYEHFEIWRRIMDSGRRVAAGGDRQRRHAFEFPVIATWSLIDMLLALGRDLEALRIAEWTKSRTLLDIQARGSSDVDVSRLSAAELRERDELETRVSRLKHERGSQLRRARVELESFRALMAAKYPPAVASRDASQPGHTLAPPRDTALVEYVVARDAVFVWAITAHRVTARRIAIGEAALEELVATHVRRIESRDFRWAESGGKLFEILLGPVWEDVRGARAIGFVPDRMIWQVPMQTLPAPDGKLLVEHAELFYVPSLTVLAELGERRTPSSARATAVVIADPGQELPGAADEAKKVAASYGSSTLLAGTRADETAVRAAIPNAAILHFATHGQLDDGDPMFSHLLLRRSGNRAGEDGFLEAWEIARMRLDADLAVLSACETARGALSYGEGLIGMSWAFLAAGTRTTVVSQWNVDSRATSALMADFHRLHAAGATPSAALRAAQLRLMEQPRYRHPLYWAPFIVVGAP